jgi:hypothetical protein
MNIKSMKLVLAVSAAAALVACGGTDPVVVASANVVAPATAATAAAIVGQTFSFPAGVTELGTTAATTLAVSGTASAQSATIASAGQTATGPMTYGSCVLTITTSTFPASSPLGLGKTLIINPCNITVATAGATANGGSSNRNASLVLGTSTSSPLLIPVVLNTNGSVSVGGITLGTVATTVSGT